MATACLADPAAAFAQMADDYIHQHYEHAPGKAPKAAHVSEVFGAKLAERFGGREAQVLEHPRYRLHVFTSRGRHLLRREGRLAHAAGLPGRVCHQCAEPQGHGRLAGARGLLRRRASRCRCHLHDFRTHVVPLRADNLHASLLASCSIPFWLQAVHDIPGAPARRLLGRRHHRLPPAPELRVDATSGLVLYPHFQKTVIPGWLDKALQPPPPRDAAPGQRRRAVAEPGLDRHACRTPSCPTAATSSTTATTSPRAWPHGRRAVRESERLADEFARWLDDPARIEPLPLA